MRKPKLMCGILAVILCLGLFAACKADAPDDSTTNATTELTTVETTTEPTAEAPTETTTQPMTTKASTTTKKAPQSTAAAKPTNAPPAPQTEKAPPKRIKGEITLAQYNQVQIGMTYEEVTAIFGRTGYCPVDELVQFNCEIDSDIADSEMTLYKKGVTANFTNGILESIHQQGLE